MLTQTQKFASSVVLSQVCPPKLMWSKEFDKVSVGGETLELDTFRSGIQNMLQTAWELYDYISGGNRFADDLPKNFKDDLSNDQHGYSFLSHGPFSKTPNGLLCHLVRNWNLASVDGARRLSWDMHALRRFFGACGQLNTLLAVLTYILPSTSTRITEFVDQKLRNDLRNRGLHMHMDEMFLLARYHKMTNATGFDICTPAFYPKPLQDLTLEIFAGGLRECETILAPVLFGSKSAGLYHMSVGLVFWNFGSMC